MMADSEEIPNDDNEASDNNTAKEEPLSEGAKKAFVDIITSFIHPGY